MTDLTRQPLLPRRELTFKRVESSGKHRLNRERWIVFDPVSRNSFRIGWIEHWLLSRINGKLNFSQLANQFRADNPEAEVSDSQFMHLLERFSQSNLFKLRGKVEHAVDASLQSKLAGFILWRVRGLNPDRWLGKLVPHTGPLLSHQAVLFWCTAAIVTTLLVVFEYRRVIELSHLWGWLMSPYASGGLFAVFLATRAVHELGHALACKRFGVRCPDIGLFVIMGAPCVYCDVSESWSLTKRWQRAAVAAAGMYVEVIIATIAAWVWLLTNNGPVNTLALQTMFVCSISTLLVNANPLMRFDGYHIAADLFDETNLRSKADGVAYHALGRVLLGADFGVQLQKNDFKLILFSIAGWIYRAFLSATIATVIVMVATQWKMIWPGRLMSAIIIFSWWGIPMFGLVKSLMAAANDLWKRFRLLGFSAAIVLAAAYLPIPTRRFASGWNQPKTSQGIFAAVGGRLKSAKVKDGESVKLGQPLFELSSPSLKLVSLRKGSEFEQAKARLESNKRIEGMYRQELDSRSSETQVENAEERAANAERDLEKLILKAPIAGKFSASLAPDLLVGEPPEAEPWTTRQQLGREVAPGTRLGYIYSEDSVAVIPLTEEQLRDVAAGTIVRLRTVSPIPCVFETKVQSIVQMRELNADWQSAPEQEAMQSPSQASALKFAAVIEMDGHKNAIPGATVDATFVVPSITLAEFATSWLRANLRLLAD